MRKIGLLFMFMLSSLLGFSQYSSITIEINDNDRAFMDTVEAKLIRHVIDIQHRKKTYDITLYGAEPYNSGHWSFQYTKSQVDSAFPPKNKIATYKYNLDMQWDSSLTNVYVYGFSKLYFQPINQWVGWVGGHSEQRDVINYPIYNIPLCQYYTFLNKNEIDKLYSIIRKEFIKCIDDDTIYKQDSSMTLRTFEIRKSDSLAQMPWDYWIRTYDNEVRDKENPLRVYKSAKLTNALNPWVADSSIYMYLTTVSKAGTSTLEGEADAFFSGVVVAEEWSFDTNKADVNYPMFEMKYFMRISKTTRAIGIVRKKTEQYKEWKLIAVNPLWLDAKDIDVRFCQISRHPGSLYLYKELINSALYKKLKLRYLPY